LRPSGAYYSSKQESIRYSYTNKTTKSGVVLRVSPIRIKTIAKRKGWIKIRKIEKTKQKIKLQQLKKRIN